MNKDMFDALVQWQQDLTSERAVSIDIGKAGDRDAIKIWCYDMKASTGKFVNSPSDLEGLDFVALRRAQLEEQLAMLN
jgi:hypothetical protein